MFDVGRADGGEAHLDIPESKLFRHGDDNARIQNVFLATEDGVRAEVVTLGQTVQVVVGLAFCPDPGEAPSEYLDSHRTRRDVGTSVGRWQREPLSDVVRTCLETHSGIRSSRKPCSYL